jgi:hypothetical protein
MMLFPVLRGEEIVTTSGKINSSTSAHKITINFIISMALLSLLLFVLN